MIKSSIWDARNRRFLVLVESQEHESDLQGLLDFQKLPRYTVVWLVEVYVIGLTKSNLKTVNSLIQQFHVKLTVHLTAHF